MFIVRFEATLPAAKAAVSGAYYSKIAPLLHKIEGFISETGYASPQNEKKYLTYAKFEDEPAAHRWRLNSEHLRIQHKARHGVFEDFRLRCGNDFSVEDQPAEEDVLASTSRPDQYVIVYEEPNSLDKKDIDQSQTLKARAPFSKASSVFDDASEITTYQGEDSAVWLVAFQSKEAAVRCRNSQAFKDAHGPSADVRLIRITRDYGKANRKEAPAGADEAQAASLAES